MASNRRTYTAAEAAIHILEGDESELDRIDVDLVLELRYVYKLGSVSLSEKIPMTADANNNNSRGHLPGTGDREMCSRRNSVVFG